MIKKYNSFIKEEKKFQGLPGPENPKCSFVDIDKKDITTYAKIFKKLEDDKLISLVDNRAWYLKGDIDTKSILTDDEHKALGYDEENESVKVTENIFDEPPGGYKSKKVELSKVKSVIGEFIKNKSLSLNGTTLEELISKIEGYSVRGGDAGPR